MSVQTADGFATRGKKASGRNGVIYDINGNTDGSRAKLTTPFASHGWARDTDDVTFTFVGLEYSVNMDSESIGDLYRSPCIGAGVGFIDCAVEIDNTCCPQNGGSRSSCNCPKNARHAPFVCVNSTVELTGGNDGKYYHSILDAGIVEFMDNSRLKLRVSEENPVCVDNCVKINCDDSWFDIDSTSALDIDISCDYVKNGVYMSKSPYQSDTSFHIGGTVNISLNSEKGSTAGVTCDQLILDGSTDIEISAPGTVKGFDVNSISAEGGDIERGADLVRRQSHAFIRI